MHDERPRWAQRLLHLRRSRGWSQQQAVDALTAAADEPLAENDSLLRKWKRWESGANLPDHRTRPLVARAFGVDADALFAAPRQAGAVTTDPAVVEPIARIDRSDVDQSSLDRIAVAVDQICAAYSALPAMDLLSETRFWFGRLDQLLGQRLGTAQHRQISEIQGWLALLVGSIHYDTAQHRQTQLVARYVDRLAADTGNTHHQAWTRELHAWMALNSGDYQTAVAEATAGQALAPRSPVAAQLAGHEAEAHARMGDQVAALVAFDKLNQHRSRLVRPAVPRHHFQPEPSKFDKTEMRLHSLLGRHTRALTIGEHILRALGGIDRGATTYPMRTATALATMATAAAASGDLDQAVATGHQALDIPRRSIPSLISATTNLHHTLVAFPHEPAAAELVERIDQLRRPTA